MSQSTSRRRMTGGSSRPRGSSNTLRSSAPSPSDQIRRLKDEVAHLAKENGELKDRLRVLRKAAAPTTKLVHLPTQFTEVKVPERDSLKLPRLGNKREATVDLEPEIKRLQAQIEALNHRIDDMTESHAARVESLEAQLDDKISKAKEASADINRLQALVQSLQARLDAQSKDDNARDRSLEATIQYLKEQLVGAQQAAASCAHIAKVNEVEAQEARATSEDLRRKLRDAQRVAKDAVENAEAQQALMERERAVYKEKEDALKVTLDKMKIAWTKREAEWQEYNAKRNDQWKKDAAEWMRTAQTKLTDLQNGTDYLRRISVTMENHGTGGQGADSSGPEDSEPPYP